MCVCKYMHLCVCMNMELIGLHQIFRQDFPIVTQDCPETYSVVQATLKFTKFSPIKNRCCPERRLRRLTKERNGDRAAAPRQTFPYSFSS